MSKAIIIDTETTGLIEPIEAIEVAHLVLSDSFFESFDSVSEFSQRYKPSVKISYGALATHGITHKMLEDSPPSGTYVLPEGSEYIIGHNIDYDWKVIGSPNVKRIDTVGIFRVVFNDIDSCSQLACLYRVDENLAGAMRDGAHGALADIKMNLVLLNFLVNRIGVKNWEDLYTISENCRIPEKMPFGKYANTSIQDLPSDYKSWCLSKNGLTNANHYLLRAIGGEKNATLESIIEIARNTGNKRLFDLK